MGEHYEDHGSKTVKVIADISDIEFGYLSSFVADPELSASKELTNRVLKKVLVRLGAEDKILCEGDHILWNTGIPSHSGCKIIGYGKIDSSGTLRIIKFAESQSGIMTGWLDRFGSMPEAMDFYGYRTTFQSQLSRAFEPAAYSCGSLLHITQRISGISGNCMRKGHSAGECCQDRGVCQILYHGPRGVYTQDSPSDQGDADHTGGVLE